MRIHLASLALLVSCTAPQGSTPPSAEPIHPTAASPTDDPGSPDQEGAASSELPPAHDWDPRSSEPDRIARLDTAILDELQATWNVRSVATHDDSVRVQTGMRVVDERVYRAMLPLIAMVYEHDGGVPRSIENIEVANRFGTSGWVFTEAQNLGALLDVPLASYDETVAEATSPLRP